MTDTSVFVDEIKAFHVNEGKIKFLSNFKVS